MYLATIVIDGSFFVLLKSTLRITVMLNSLWQAMMGERETVFESLFLENSFCISINKMLKC